MSFLLIVLSFQDHNTTTLVCGFDNEVVIIFWREGIKFIYLEVSTRYIGILTHFNQVYVDQAIESVNVRTFHMGGIEGGFRLEFYVSDREIRAN